MTASTPTRRTHPKPKPAELAKNYTTEDYWLDVRNKQRRRIASAIYRRFQERYLRPISRPNVKHGFTMMAVACLMVEALESFRRGWPDTRYKSEHAFCSFFDAHARFAPFRRHASNFYKGVRCGILHQAETTLGWRIRRDAPRLLTIASGIRTINATMFVIALRDTLKEYRDRLKTAPWDGELWQSLREKMKAVCKNCEAE